MSGHNKNIWERNWTKNPDGTDKPFRKFKPDPNNPDKVIYKDRDGKTKSKYKPEGYDEWWNSKKRKK